MSIVSIGAAVLIIHKGRYIDDYHNLSTFSIHAIDPLKGAMVFWHESAYWHRQ